MIGQSQVTEPLMTALRGDRVGHAYLFSGPRGCGKTTSARILARCLNCAEGPTDVPCGTCDSCVELSRGGGGSLDVVEIDAASHNGVDDARDLRERAIFAPARDRFKIFILDEAHMVTAQGFNALLKLVEEPPAHVKFIFATTEPEKVIGTIRSRTHHYPFRLVAPAPMLSYVEELCAQENVQVEQGVLPLVVRAGGGSPRDTLSLLDQLIAGSEDGVVAYPRAVALLGYTHAELLDEVVSAFGSRDAAAAFAAVDRVVQTGQDPRRFVDDLLERLRDLIVISATGDDAAAVLRGVPSDELQRMAVQAARFEGGRLSRVADLVVAALDDMSGATSPRLQLELLIARVLADAPTGSPVVAPAPVAAAAAPAVAMAAAVPASTPASAVPTPTLAEAAPPATAPVPPAPAVPAGPVTLERIRDTWPEILLALEPVSRSSWMLASGAVPVAYADEVLTLAFARESDLAAFKKRAAGKGPSEDLRGAIAGVLGIGVKYKAHLIAPEPPEGAGLEGPGPDEPPADGPDDSGPDGGGPGGYGGGPGGPGGPGGSGGRAPAPGPAAPPQGAASPGPSRPAGRPAGPTTAPVTDWAVAPIPGGISPTALAVDDEPPLPEDVFDEPTRADDVTVAPTPTPTPTATAPAPAAQAPARSRGSVAEGVERVGEAVVRQVLGATYVRDEPYSAPTRFN